MNPFRAIVDFWRRYQGELVIAALSIAAGVTLGRIADILFQAAGIDQVIVGLLISVLLFIVGLAASIKRNITWKVRYLEAHLAELFGRYGRTQYVVRLSHFPEEKNLLAEELVRHQLPVTIKQLLKDFRAKNNRMPGRIVVLVDSGTTLAPIFPKLRRHGYGFQIPKDIKERIHIYTNSLSGIAAFDLEDRTAGEIPETGIHLLGGNPLDMYRATTGEDTRRAMENLRKQYEMDSDVIIGIVTANWILVGPAYDRLILCAKGRGHLEFKEQLVKMADRIIVVAPLGKLLRLNSHEDLNEILRKEGMTAYDSFDIKQKSKEDCSVSLLTTFRRRRGSLLFYHSSMLARAHDSRAGSKPYYDINPSSKSLAYDPMLPKEQQWELDVPHDYLRPHADILLGILR